MTKEESIKWAPEIAAFQQGKTIQIFIRKWVDDPNPDFSIKSKYRIKPESTKRLPTIEEVKEWFMENRVFMYKEKSILRRIEHFDICNHIGKPLFIGGEWITIENFCKMYTHADGLELYINE